MGNLSDSEGEEEEARKVASKPKNKKTDENEEEVVKERPVVETFEEDNYDALDFDLSSDSDEENMEVDKSHEEVIKKEESNGEVKPHEEMHASAEEPEVKSAVPVELNEISQPSVNSELKIPENDHDHPLKPQQGAKDGKSKKSKKKKTFASLLESLDYGWKMRHVEDMAKLKAERENLSNERQGFAYEAHLDGLRKHFKNLMGSQNEESFGRLVDSIAATRSLPGCCNMVCDLAYQQLVGEHKDTPLLSES